MAVSRSDLSNLCLPEVGPSAFQSSRSPNPRIPWFLETADAPFLPLLNQLGLKALLRRSLHKRRRSLCRRYRFDCTPEPLRDLNAASNGQQLCSVNTKGFPILAALVNYPGIVDSGFEMPKQIRDLGPTKFRLPFHDCRTACRTALSTLIDRTVLTYCKSSGARGETRTRMLLRHRLLRPACLPIPPPGHSYQPTPIQRLPKKARVLEDKEQSAPPSMATGRRETSTPAPKTTASRNAIPGSTAVSRAGRQVPLRQTA